jgi:citrate synthase
MTQGLEGVVAASTRLSLVDGEAGRLVIAGYLVDDLAPRATFEEVVYLLLHGRLPDDSERAALTADLARAGRCRRLPAAVLRAAADARTPPMDALRMVVPLLSLGRRGDPMDDALTAIAAFPTIVGAYWRTLSGEAPVPVRTDLSHAAHYLHQLFGVAPSAERARGLETYLNTVCDHGFNASTFTARVIVSTQSDVISALTGAVGALKGPLHGGAPGPALDMVFDIGSADRADAGIRARLDRGERLMGFGHRVYRVRDPRADVLAAAAERFYATDGDRSLYDLARRRRGRGAATTAASANPIAGSTPTSSSTPRCCCTDWDCRRNCSRRRSRSAAPPAGPRIVWSSCGKGRLIRPQSEYIGPRDLSYKHT